jgi:hypothetical protein
VAVEAIWLSRLVSGQNMYVGVNIYWNRMHPFLNNTSGSLTGSPSRKSALQQYRDTVSVKSDKWRPRASWANPGWNAASGAPEFPRAWCPSTVVGTSNRPLSVTNNYI